MAETRCFFLWGEKFHPTILGFLRGGVQGEGVTGTLRIPREDWGTLGNIRND